MPLGSLLSCALVACTVEFDNEFERRLIEPTGETFETWKREVFLVSLAMWANYLRFLADGEKSVAELGRLALRDDAAIRSALNGLTRWRYVTVESPPRADGRKPPFRDWLIRPTPVGERCLRIWEPLPAVIEERWCERFGASDIHRLKRRLARVLGQRGAPAPNYLPLVSSRREMYSEVAHGSQGTVAAADAPLYVLLAQTLLAFTLDFEADSPLALPPCANALRILGLAGIPVRELPDRSGVSKEAIAQALNLLGRHGLVAVESMATERGKQARLTASGLASQAAYAERLRLIEQRWYAEFGADATGALRQSLDAIVVTRQVAQSPLAQGLVPHPCTWRATRTAPEVLPDHPIVLGRGGWPDGS